ncbi:MAG: hypothetical protein RR346_11970 [Bacteroidales bacterium]
MNPTSNEFFEKYTDSEYLVFNIADLARHLDENDIATLDRIGAKYAQGRSDDGKGIGDYFVISRDKVPHISGNEEFLTIMGCAEIQKREMFIPIAFKPLSPQAVIPARSTRHAIGFDLVTPREVVIHPGRNLIPIDLAVEMPMYVEGKIEPRSGFSLNGMLDAYGNRRDADVIVGKIDPDYRQCIGVIVKSSESEPFIIAAKERIAQITFYQTAPVDIIVTDHLSAPESNRNGGFGHTGSKVE